MRLAWLTLAAMLWCAPASAQAAGSSSQDGALSPARQADTATDTQAPVSLDRIREQLKKTSERPLLQGLDREADFRIEVREQAKIDEILSKMDFRSGPAPAGGLYAYEQQRRLFNPTAYPLMQPYAAFSGGELITIAIENLIAGYLGGRLMSSLADGARDRSEAAAREEVDRAIADYCAARPDRDNIQLCARR